MSRFSHYFGLVLVSYSVFHFIGWKSWNDILLYFSCSITTYQFMNISEVDVVVKTTLHFSVVF